MEQQNDYMLETAKWKTQLLGHSLRKRSPTPKPPASNRLDSGHPGCTESLKHWSRSVSSACT